MTPDDLGFFRDRLSTQQRQIETLAQQLLAISEAVAARADSADDAVVNWRSLPPDRAAAEWSTLRDWVDWLRDRYSLDTKALPWCWYLHGALVEELTALADAHTAAYAADAQAGAAASWHDTLARTLPRLREWAARTSCKPGEHHADITMDPGESDGHWQRHLRALDPPGRHAEQGRNG